MAPSTLAAYLNDHLAGSVVALEMLAHLERATAGTAVAGALAAVRAAIAEDRGALESIMARLGVAESRPRQAAAWLGEKAAQLKLAFDDAPAGALRLFEGLEAVSLGIEGKRGLWRALATVAPAHPLLQPEELAELVRRAEEQRQQVEAIRLSLAPEALAR